MKVSELEGALLDHYVARALGWIDKGLGYWGTEAPGTTAHRDDWRPSTDWSHGGPVIESQRIEVRPHTLESGEDGWGAAITLGDYVEGKTVLLAAMRALVANKFGDEVQAKPLPEGVRPWHPVNKEGNYYAVDGTFMNADGTRSIFDDVEE